MTEREAVSVVVSGGERHGLLVTKGTGLLVRRARSSVALPPLPERDLLAVRSLGGIPVAHGPPGCEHVSHTYRSDTMQTRPLLPRSVSRSVSHLAPDHVPRAVRRGELGHTSI